MIFVIGLFTFVIMGQVSPKWTAAAVCVVVLAIALYTVATEYTFSNCQLVGTP